MRPRSAILRREGDCSQAARAGRTRPSRFLLGSSSRRSCDDGVWRGRGFRPRLETLPSSHGLALWQCGWGATVHVRHRDAQKAREVLDAARAKPSVSLPPWICPSCGQRVAGEWDACWQCGHLADGTLASPTAEDSDVQPRSEADTGTWLHLPRLFAAAAGVLLVVLLEKYGWQPPVMVAPFVVILTFLLWQFEPSLRLESQPQGSAEPGELSSHTLSATRSAAGNAVVRRAWQAAVLGAFRFPPLGFYSMRLLWKIWRRDTPLRWADACRCWTAFFFEHRRDRALFGLRQLVLFGIYRLAGV